MPEQKDKPLWGRVQDMEETVNDLSECLCGCAIANHESNGEDGESCVYEEHVCIRVFPSVLSEVQRLRRKVRDA